MLFSQSSTIVYQSERIVNPQAILRILTYFVAVLILFWGVIVLAGLFLPESIPPNFRIMLGIVLILYSIYRIVIIWTKKQARREYEE